MSQNSTTLKRSATNSPLPLTQLCLNAMDFSDAMRVFEKYSMPLAIGPSPFTFKALPSSEVNTPITIHRKIAKNLFTGITIDPFTSFSVEVLEHRLHRCVRCSTLLVETYLVNITQGNFGYLYLYQRIDGISFTRTILSEYWSGHQGYTENDLFSVSPCCLLKYTLHTVYTYEDFSNNTHYFNGYTFIVSDLNQSFRPREKSIVNCNALDLFHQSKSDDSHYFYTWETCLTLCKFRYLTYYREGGWPGLGEFLLRFDIESNPGPTTWQPEFDEYVKVQKKPSKTLRNYPQGYWRMKSVKKMSKKYPNDINKAQRAANKDISQHARQQHDTTTLSNLMKKLDVQPQFLVDALIAASKPEDGEEFAANLKDLQDLLTEIISFVPSEHMYKIRLISKILLLSLASSSTQMTLLVADTLISAQDGIKLMIDSTLIYALGCGLVRILSYIKSKIYHLDEEQVVIVTPQSQFSPFTSLFEDNCSIAAMIAAISASFAGILCVGKIPDKRTIDTFLIRCHTLPRAFKSINEVFGYFRTSFYEFLSMNFPSLHNDINLKSDSVKFAEHSAKNLKLTKEIQEDAAVFDHSLMTSMRDYFLEHLTLCDYAVRTKNQPLLNSLKTLDAAIYRNHAKMQSSPASGMIYRQEPCAVLITGPPGVGKSVMSRVLAAHNLKATGVTSEQLKKASPNSFIYNRTPGQPFWTNYDATRHHVCIVDDANQVQLAFTDGLPFVGEFIGLKNSAPNSLNVAECDLKKYAYFNSRLMILTDNAETPEVERVIRSTEAYERRIDFHIVCSLIKDAPLDYINFTHIKVLVTQLNLQNKKKDTYEMTFAEFIPLVQNRIHEYGDIFRTSGDSLTTIVNQYYQPAQQVAPQISDEDLQSRQDRQELLFHSRQTQPRVVCCDNQDVFEASRQQFAHTQNYANDHANFLISSRTANGPPLTRWEKFYEWVMLEIIVFRQLFSGSHFSFVSYLTRMRIVLFMFYYRLIKRECYAMVLMRCVTQVNLMPRLTQRSKRLSMFALLAAAPMVLIGITLHHYFKRRKAELINPQSYSNQPKQSRRPPPRNRVVVSKSLATKVAPQILTQTDRIPITFGTNISPVIQLDSLTKPVRSLDSNSDEIAEKVKNNVYIISYEYICPHEEEKIRKRASVHCTVLKGQIAFVVWHFIEFVRYTHGEQSARLDSIDGYPDCLTITRPSYLQNTKPITLRIDIDVFLMYARTFENEQHCSFADGALVFLGVSVPLHRDIAQYLLNEKQLETLKAIYVRRISINLKSNCVEHFVGPTVYRYLSTNTYPLSINDGAHCMISDWFLYRAANAQGLCSAPILAIDPTLTKKLIGFHSGDFGDNGSSVASHLTRETFDLYIDFINNALPSPHNVRAQMSLLDSELLSPPRFNHCFTDEMVIPVATYPHKAVIAKSSRIQPSLIHSKLTQPIAFPAKLQNFVNESGTYVNVLKNSVSKQFNTSCHILAEDLEFAENECEFIFGEIFEDQQPRLLTHAETIMGGLEGLNPIPRSTSPGYPYLAQSRTSSGKHPWLGTGDEYTLDNKFLLSEVEKYVANAKQMRRTIQPYTVQLKDETRDPERVKLGKTRTFTASNLTLTYLLRKYFGTISARSITHGKHIGMLPGMNYHGTDSTVVVNYCQTISPLHLQNFCAGDFSNFDGTLNERVLAIIMDTWIKHLNLNPDDQKVAAMLSLDIFNAMLLIDDQIVMNTHSLPSGCPMTTILNTWYNKIIASMVMRRIILKNCRYLLPRLHQLYGLIAYGDDNVFIISPELRQFVDPDEITKEMTFYGMTYTSGDKHNLISYDYFKNISILKRSFVYNDILGRWTMPLDLKVILEIMNWDRKTNEHDKKDQLKMNLDFLSLELMYHGKSVWTEWMNKALALVRPLVPNLPYYSYETTIESTMDVSLTNLKSSTIPDEWAQMYLHRTGAQVFPQIGFTLVHKPTTVCTPQLLVTNPQESSPSNQTSNDDSATPSQMDVTSNQTSESLQLVTFDDAAPAVSQLFPGASDFSSTELQPGTEHRDHSVMQVLQRPTQIIEIEVPPGGDPDTAVTILYQAKFPELLFEAEQNLADKVSFFTFIRGTGKLKGIMSTNPNTQGLLIAAFIPDLADEQIAKRILTIGQLTQYSHVVINLNSGIGFEIPLPFLSTYTHKPLYALPDGVQAPNNGTIIIAKLTPVSGLCSIKLYAYYDTDLHLEHPTSLPLDPSLSLTSRKLHWLSKHIGSILNKFPIMRDTYPGNVTPQMEQQVQQKKGILSGVLSTASAISSSASNLPFVGSAASAVTPLLTIGSNLLGALGFCKPINQQPTNPLRQNPFSDHLVAEGQDVAAGTTYHLNNTVKASPGDFGTDIDEMCIETVARREQIIPMQSSAKTVESGKFVRSVTNTLPPRSLVALIPISPAFWLTPVDVESDNYVSAYPTHFSWLYSFFSYWSATVKLRFIFAMTGFHKVQLRFVFIPGATPPTDFSTLSFNNSNSTVKALSAEESEHCMEIPALRPVNMFRCGTYAKDVIDNTNCAGYVAILTETKLSYSDTVAPYINFVTYAHLTDVQLAIPSTIGTVLPVSPEELIRTQVKRMEVNRTNVSPQMDAELNMRTSPPSYTQTQITEQNPTLATSSTAKVITPIPAAGSIGEITTSLTQITRCFTRTGSIETNISHFDYRAPYIYTPSFYTEETFDDVPFGNIDLLDSIGAAYAFQKGGYVVRVVPEGHQNGRDGITNQNPNHTWKMFITETIRSPVEYFINSKIARLSTDALPLPNLNSRYILMRPDLEGGLTVHMPFNQPTGRILNSPPTASQFMTPIRYTLVIPSENFFPKQTVSTLEGLSEEPATITTKSGDTLNFFRRGADDFRFGVLIALPQMAFVKNAVS
jgi:hypothetical protein